MAEQYHYDILQVSVTAEPEVVEAAYRRLCKKYHPDVNTGHDSKRRMIQLNAAFEVLGDPSRRAEYDRGLSRRPSGERRRQRKDRPTKSQPPIMRVSTRIIGFGSLPQGRWEPFSFDIENVGSGQLSGSIQSSTQHIEIEETRFSGNRVTVRGRASLPNGRELGLQGHVNITSNGGLHDIIIKIKAEKAMLFLEVSPPVLIVSLSPGDDTVEADILVRRSDGLPASGTIASSCKWARLHQSSFGGSETRLGLRITRPAGVKLAGLYRAKIRI